MYLSTTWQSHLLVFYSFIFFLSDYTEILFMTNPPLFILNYCILSPNPCGMLYPNFLSLSHFSTISFSSLPLALCLSLSLSPPLHYICSHVSGPALIPAYPYFVLPHHVYTTTYRPSTFLHWKTPPFKSSVAPGGNTLTYTSVRIKARV